MESKYPHFYQATSGIFQRAKNLRKPLTPAEQVLWKLLRNRKLNQYKFRRQHPIYHFIADFYCHELKLVIELDGSIHQRPDVAKHDRIREEILINLGLTVSRFSNKELFTNSNNVIKKILEVAERIKSGNT
jgi:very-short-patch-repair endonuclease